MRVTLLCLAALASCAAPPSFSPRDVESLRAYRSSSAAKAPQVGQPGWNMDVNAIIGGRHLDDRTWGNLDDQFTSGVEFNARPANSPLGMEFGISSSFDYEEEEVGVTDFDTFGSLFEIYAGARLTFEAGPLRPFVGAGVTGVLAEIDLDGFMGAQDDDDGSVGGYVHGGFYAEIDRFNIGVDIRHVYGTDVDLFTNEGDADYFQVALMFGGNF